MEIKTSTSDTWFYNEMAKAVNHIYEAQLIEQSLCKNIIICT